MGLNKKTLVFVLVFVVGVFVLSVSIVAIVAPETFDKPYSAVFTNTGEFYVGKMHNWPFSSTIILKDVFTLQRSGDNQGGIQLIPLSVSLWSPDKIYFNRVNVVFTGKISPESEIMKTIQQYKNGAVVPQPPVNPIPPATE